MPLKGKIQHLPTFSKSASKEKEFFLLCPSLTNATRLKLNILFVWRMSHLTLIFFLCVLCCLLLRPRLVCYICQKQEQLHVLFRWKAGRSGSGKSRGKWVAASPYFFLWRFLRINIEHALPLSLFLFLRTKSVTSPRKLVLSGARWTMKKRLPTTKWRLTTKFGTQQHLPPTKKPMITQITKRRLPRKKPSRGDCCETLWHYPERMNVNVNDKSK